MRAWIQILESELMQDVDVGADRLAEKYRFPDLEGEKSEAILGVRCRAVVLLHVEKEIAEGLPFTKEHIEEIERLWRAARSQVNAKYWTKNATPWLQLLRKHRAGSK